MANNKPAATPTANAAGSGTNGALTRVSVDQTEVHVMDFFGGCHKAAHRYRAPHTMAHTRRCQQTTFASCAPAESRFRYRTAPKELSGIYLILAGTRLPSPPSLGLSIINGFTSSLVLVHKRRTVCCALGWVSSILLDLGSARAAWCWCYVTIINSEVPQRTGSCSPRCAQSLRCSGI